MSLIDQHQAKEKEDCETIERLNAQITNQTQQAADLEGKYGENNGAQREL